MTQQISQTAPFVALTTPLYYVNDIPHIGSAYTTMAADAIARFWRLQGRDVLLITGTDEHGQKIERTAQANGISPQEQCDRIVPYFQSLWHKLSIHYDRFSRTTAPRHEEIVAQFWQRLVEQGDIYRSQKQGWYCVSCEEFKEERELLPGGFCAIHSNKKAEWRDEENYFFRLSRYQDPLEKLYRDRPDFIQPASRRNEVLNFVKQGLQDFSISRINLDWGVRVPGDPQHTIYVWFDALLGYVTALLPEEAEANLETALSHWPIQLHLIGKDILRFHSVYWPALLMSAGLEPPGRVFGHGFLTKDGQKMGKSLGNTLDPFALVDRYGADAVRYYFLREIEFGQDGDFNESRFVNLVNADLANDLGNLLNRTLKMAHKYFQGNLTAGAAMVEEDDPLVELARDLASRVKRAYDNLAFSRAVEEILRLLSASNKYLDERAPWSLFKQGKHEQVEAILYTVLESVRLSAYLLSPIVPGLASKIYRQLGYSIDFASSPATAPFETHASWGVLGAGQALEEPQPVFARLEQPSENTL